MIEALCLALVAILSGAVGAYRGWLIGRAMGHREGQDDYRRRLALAKDPDCWTAAHYLEVNALETAPTQRLQKD